MNKGNSRTVAHSLTYHSRNLNNNILDIRNNLDTPKRIFSCCSQVLAIPTGAVQAKLGTNELAQRTGVLEAIF